MGSVSSLLRYRQLKDKEDNSFIFMRYIMCAFRTPITFTSGDKNKKFIFGHLDQRVTKLWICLIFIREHL